MRRTFGALFAVVALLIGLLAAVPSVARPAAPHVTVMVHGAHGSIEAALGALASVGLPVIHPMRAIGVAVTTASASAVRKLASDPRVQRVQDVPAQPPTLHLDTSLRAIRAPQRPVSGGHSGFASHDGRGVGIAVIDTGADSSHPMFQLPDGGSSIARNMEFLCQDAVRCGVAANSSGVFVDVVDSDGPSGGHGTHVASTAAGQPVTLADGRSMRGVAPGARLYVLGMTFDVGPGTWAAIAAMNWVAENHRHPCGIRVPAAKCPPIRVLNNSWGWGTRYDPDSAEGKAVTAVLDAGVFIAWSAGNGGERPDRATTTGATHGPELGLMSVASYDDLDLGGQDGSLSRSSSRGLPEEPETYPDISAPGNNITAACRIYMAICHLGRKDSRDPNYNTLSGTSMAAPHIAGAAAVLLQAAPGLSAVDIERVIEATAHKFDGPGSYEPDPDHPGRTTSYDRGHGLLDLSAALARVAGGGLTP